MMDGVDREQLARMIHKPGSFERVCWIMWLAAYFPHQFDTPTIPDLMQKFDDLDTQHKYEAFLEFVDAYQAMSGMDES